MTIRRRPISDQLASAAFVFVAASTVLLMVLIPPARPAPSSSPSALPAGTRLRFETAFTVYPQDCNANPPMCSGGKLLAEMDRCAGITTRRFLYSAPAKAQDAVTVALNAVTFHHSAQVKDLLILTGTVTKTGLKTIFVKVTVERDLVLRRELLVDGEFVFCAYDLAAGHGVPHGLVLPPAP